MASSDRRLSLSPGERQRTKSQSSSRSHRTPPNIIVYEEDVQQDQTRPQTSRRNTRDANLTKPSESPTSNRSIASPTSNISRKQRTSLKSSSPPIANRRRNSKRKKSSISVSELEKRQLTEPNDSEKQDLSARGLAMIPVEIFELTTLRRLILSNNNISSLPPTISSLINLEYFDLSNNPLIVRNGHDDYSCFPREFRYLRNLQTLILSECTLKYVPMMVWNIVSLQTLDLNRNKVGYIVSDIGNLIDLRHLRLSEMDLGTLPPEIGFCDKLETLDLTGNSIDTLPETLIECRQLYELKLNYKTFYHVLDDYMLQLIDEGKIRSEHIPQVIFELENLRTLDLSQTKINSFPIEHTLFHLTELYLSNNSFFDIPESICTIEQLKILDLSHNQIYNIPEYFIKIQNLEILNLSYNRLTTVSQFFIQLLKLKKLILNHNKIHLIDKEFSQNQSIIILDLSYNNLINLPNELCYLKQLETLDLRYNKLEYLPSSIRQMIGLKSMNTFNDIFQRTGLHLLGNSIIDPPSYIWKSTDIQTLFNYIEMKEKTLLNSYYHLKLIILGQKNTGKTIFVSKLLNNRKLISNTRKTIDMFVSILQQKQSQNINENNQHQQQTSTDSGSSTFTDQWIENRISTNDDHIYNRHLKTKRIYPPPLKIYRTNEIFNTILNKSILITKNNCFFTIFDLTYEINYEILYPLIYDSNALYILTINLTILLNILQVANSLENFNHQTIIDFNTLLTNKWLYTNIYRYFESISDHCQEVFIIILGLVDNSQLVTNNLQQQQQLLDEIHIKINEYLFNKANQRENINFYSEIFPQPIHLDDEQMSSQVIEQLEIIAQQWNLIHHKQKRNFIKQYLGLIQQDTLIIDYNTCLKSFEQQDQNSFEENNIDEIEEELNQMSFDDCLNYLKLIGDILCFGEKPNQLILLKPYYFLNEILSKTIFRSHIEQWLNYDDNIVFHFSGYYPIEKIFQIDRQRLLTRGEFTWNMLNVLFYEQNNNTIGLTEENIFHYCHLMERLYLGYINQSNLNHREFTTIYFVCPWLNNEKCLNIDYKDYFKILEQERHYEYLQCERTRRIKQQQLWFSIDNEQENFSNENSSQFISIEIPDLPLINEINIIDSQIIINQDLIQIIKIRNTKFNYLPKGFYERLLICLHSLFNERLDYYNLTLGRTIDKNLILIERSQDDNEIKLTINTNLFERIKIILITKLFSFYPNINLRIET